MKRVLRPPPSQQHRRRSSSDSSLEAAAGHGDESSHEPSHTPSQLVSVTPVSTVLEAFGHNSELTPSMLRATDRDMLTSVFCLVPAGDSAITDRLYVAIASGCLPVVLADELHGAFPSRAKYDTFWIKLPMRDFVRRPEHLLAHLRSLPPKEVAERQRRLAERRRDVLYDLEGSRVGSHFLEEIRHRCMPLLRNETQPPPNGRAWMRKCLSPQYALEKAAGSSSRHPADDG